MGIRQIALIALSGLFLIGLGTYLAGEQAEVAVLRTFDADGAKHDTKLWVADVAGVAYVRADRSGRSFGDHLGANPGVELVRGGETTRCTAAIVTDAAVRRSVDQAFAAKYGWVDWWYGLVLRSDPVPVRLDPR